MVRRPLPDGDHRSAGFSLDVGVRPSCSSFPFLYPKASGSPGTHLGLGHQGGGGPRSGSALFLSSFFVVPRPDNRPPRLMIDLSRLNDYIVAPLFSLDNHSTLAKLLSPLAFMASLDIAEAYTHVPMRSNLRQYLAFSYMGQLYFFYALPFGLNAAPFIFTQVLAWPLQCLRARGVSLLAYLPRLSLWTDASPRGRGALLEPARVASGRWSPSEASLHVNLLQLRAVFRALVFFDLHDLLLRVFTDNETVRYALASCRARSPSLRQELLTFLLEVVSRNLWFQVLRVPTALNVVADALSREAPLNTEWTLPQAAFADILRWEGPLEVNLMASPVNHRLPRWVSPFPHPDALAVDCRSIDWNTFGSFYLFPPPAMLPQLLHLILSCRSRRVVVIPWRPHNPSFPPLLQGADDHLHLLVTPYQQMGAGIVFHSSGPSTRWTALLFCARS